MSKKRKTYKKYVQSTTGTQLVGVFDSSTKELVQWLPVQGNATKGRKVLPHDGIVIDILSNDRILYPKNISEFEIQAYLFNNLLERGIDARGNVTSKNRISRFDIVIFRDKKPLHLLEIKRPGAHMSTKQRDKYEAYGLSLTIISSFKDADNFLSRFCS